MSFETNSYLRAGVHVTVTLLLAAVVWFLPETLAQTGLLLLAAFFLFFELLRVRFRGLNALFFKFLKPVLRPKEWWDATGAAYVLWGAAATALCFPREVAAASLCFLAVGDAASSTIGCYCMERNTKAIRKRRCIGCLLVSIAAAAALYFLGLQLHPAVLFTGAVSAAALECLPIRVNDNLRIPLGSGLVMLLLSLLW